MNRLFTLALLMMPASALLTAMSGCGFRGLEASADAPAADPFEPKPRLDPDKLPGAAESVIPVLLEIDGRPLFSCPGYVFDADERLAYVVAEYQENRYSGSFPRKALTYTYRAVVGPPPDAHGVPLEVVYRYPHLGCILLSGSKADLPPPLPVPSSPPDVTIGRRLHLVGFEPPPDVRDVSRPMFARAAELATITPTTARAEPAPLFSVETFGEVRVHEGLLVDAEGSPQAVARYTQKIVKQGQPTSDLREYACHPLTDLQQFREPDLTKFVFIVERKGKNVEISVRAEVFEPRSTLRRPRLLIASQPLDLWDPKPPPEGTRIKSWHLPSAVGRPRFELSAENASKLPTDYQEVALSATPADAPKRTNYAALHTVDDPSKKLFYYQLVFDDENGATRLLGSEKPFRVNP
jgi:hypothetical protein